MTSTNIIINSISKCILAELIKNLTVFKKFLTKLCEFAGNKKKFETMKYKYYKLLMCVIQCEIIVNFMITKKKY